MQQRHTSDDVVAEECMTQEHSAAAGLRKSADELETAEQQLQRMRAERTDLAAAAVAGHKQPHNVHHTKAVQEQRRFVAAAHMPSCLDRRKIDLHMLRAAACVDTSSTCKPKKLINSS